MKRGNFFANCVFAVSVILTVLSFSACTDDSNDVVATTSEVIEQAEVPFSVVLKAMNSDGNDITTKGEVNGATLFVFDQNNDFFEQINVNKSTILSRRAIDINCPNSNDITVIAWSGINSGNEEISNMSKANIISDLQVSLKENNGIANIPSDLFYGQVTLHKNSSTKSTVSNELQIIRKTSIFQLSTKGLIKYLGSNAGNFEYRIKNTKSSLDYNGNPTGDVQTSDRGFHLLDWFFLHTDFVQYISAVTGDSGPAGGDIYDSELYFPVGDFPADCKNVPYVN